MTLRWRAVLILGVIEAVTLAVIITSSLAYLQEEGKKQVMLRANEIGTMLGVAIGESLAISHYASVGEIVDAAFIELSDIDYLVAYNERGEPLASKRRGKDLGDDNDHLEVRKDIMIGNNAIGSIRLRYSTDYLMECLHRQVRTMALWGILGMFISSAATWAAATRLTSCMSLVTSRLRDVADGYPVQPLPASQGTELGRLVTAYNSAIQNLTKKRA